MIALDHAWMLALALVLDAAVGDPGFIWRRVPHPVAAIGAFIGWLDRGLNHPERSEATRRALGIVTIVLVVAVAAGVGAALEAVFARLPYGWVGTVVVAAAMLAGRSLYDHVVSVFDALRGGSLGDARAAVGAIVGRDADRLDEAGVSRAAIESLAESFSDGLVAPAFWFVLLGLPGLLAYKAINTADSMVGHLTDRHAAFGWAAARLDDVANLVPSRLSGVLIGLAAPLAAGSAGSAFRTMAADAGKHASPNAGWPEAAMAGALGLALGGAASYGGVLAERATFNGSGRRDATAGDIRRALRVYLGAASIFAAVVAVGGLAGLWP